MEKWIAYAILSAFAFGATAAMLIDQARGENYTYNLTDQLRDEIVISDICLNTDIRLDECELLVGKLGSDYGENGDGKSNKSAILGGLFD